MGVASWLPELGGSGSSQVPNLSSSRDQVLRHGKNPYQVAAQYPFSQMKLPAVTPTFPTDPKHPMQGTINNQFWNWTRSGLNYFFNPDSIGVAQYEEMLTTDESCYSAISFLIIACLAKFGRYSHPNPKIEEWVNAALENMETPWPMAKKEILTAVWAGHSATEIVVEYDGRDIVPKYLQTLHPATVTYDLWLDGAEKNQVRAARQWRYGVYGSYIPVEKAIIFTHEGRFGNVYGHSRLRNCWRSWFLKAKMLAAWALVLDRYGSPHAVATVKDGFETTTGPDGEKIDVMPLVASLLDRLAVNGSVAVTEAIKIELHQAKQAVGADFGGFISYQDRMIYRGALVPSLIGDQGDHGSYALGNTHYDLFTTMVDELDQSLNNVLIKQFIKKLIVWKFGTQKTYGTFNIEDFKQEDMKILAESFKDFVNSGTLKPSLADDLNWMRAKIGVAGLTQAVIDTQPEIVPTPGKKNPEEEAPGSAPTPDDPNPSPAGAPNKKGPPKAPRRSKSV